jgi:hypothetical protein
MKTVVEHRKEKQGLGVISALSLVSIIVTSLGVLYLQPELVSQNQPYQKLNFSIWGSPPPTVRALLNDQAGQKILFAIRREAQSIRQIARAVGEADTLVEGKIKELAQVGLVKGKGGGWISNMGLFDESDVRDVEHLGLIYAEKQAEILSGERFSDLSSPAKAFLKRLSGWYHSDSNCLKVVEVPWNEAAENMLARPESRRRAEYLAQLDIVRIRLREGDPKDGDVVPIFTSEEDTHVYFYYKGAWRFLYRTVETWLWDQDLEENIRERMNQLEHR